MRFTALIYKITHFTLYIRYFNIYFQRREVNRVINRVNKGVRVIGGLSECHGQGEAGRAAGEHGRHQR